MKIHLIKKQSVLLYVQAHARSSTSFNDWLEKIKYADWHIPSDIKQTFPAVDFLGKNSRRVVFDIGGNNFRLIAKYFFGETAIHLFICWIGTHDAYTKLCNKGLQYVIQEF